MRVMLKSKIHRIYENINFIRHQVCYGRAGTITEWADTNEFAPAILDDWITRQHIISILRKSDYQVKTVPNFLRLEVYKGSEEFIIDCPNTSKKPTPWGYRAEELTISIIPVKWVFRDIVSSYLVTDIPNRTGLVGIECRGQHFDEISKLISRFGRVIE